MVEPLLAWSSGRRPRVAAVEAATGPPSRPGQAIRIPLGRKWREPATAVWRRAWRRSMAWWPSSPAGPWSRKRTTRRQWARRTSGCTICTAPPPRCSTWDGLAETGDYAERWRRSTARFASSAVWARQPTTPWRSSTSVSSSYSWAISTPPSAPAVASKARPRRRTRRPWGPMRDWLAAEVERRRRHWPACSRRYAAAATAFDRTGMVRLVGLVRLGEAEALAEQGQVEEAWERVAAVAPARPARRRLTMLWPRRWHWLPRA